MTWETFIDVYPLGLGTLAALIARREYKNGLQQRNAQKKRELEEFRYGVADKLLQQIDTGKYVVRKGGVNETKQFRLTMQKIHKESFSFLMNIDPEKGLDGLYSDKK